MKFDDYDPICEQCKSKDARIAELEAALRDYANPDNWYDSADGTATGFAVDGFCDRDLAATFFEGG